MNDLLYIKQEVVSFYISGVFILISFWLYSASWLNNKLDLFKKIAKASMVCGLAALIFCLFFRGLSLNFFPLTNLYESLLVFAVAVICSYLFLDFKFKISSFGWIINGFLILLFLYAIFLPETQKQIVPLIPALQSYWRLVHVPPLLFSYSLFLIAGFSSVGYLIEVALVSRKNAGQNPKKVQVQTDKSGIVINSELREVSQRAHFLSEVSYRSITFGFPLLTIGIINGALWANHAWGALWQWDPKETMALVTLFVYAIYLHFRLNAKASGVILALISLLGVFMVYLTYFGVNQFNFGGLHTYGKIE